MCKGEPGKAYEDVEKMAQLIMMEAKMSFGNASRVMSKIIIVAVIGFMLASDCCSGRYLVPVGVIILAIAAGWLDAIGNECKQQRFYPSKALNSMGKYLFRWEWIVFWAFAIFALSQLRSWVPPGFYHLSQLSLEDRLWLVCTMAAAPLALMLACRALEPFRFSRARADIQNAETLLRQLAATRTASDISALAPLIEPELVPLYKLASVAKVLYDFAASYDSADKIKVNLSQNSASPQNWSLQKLVLTVYAPFRTIANNLLLGETEDLVFYSVAALYFATAYVGSNYFPWAPLTAFVPFLGPKSRVARYVRALQEDIRLAQGRPAEKKGGMTPAGIADDVLRVNWPMVAYICSSHIMAMYALLVLVVFGGVCPLFGNGRAVKSETIAWSFMLYVCGALGITAGAHRLWAHRSYKAAAPLRAVLMVFSSIANQGTIWHWARDHRVHHLYSDTPADPHDANRGFFFSHAGWLLMKKSKAVLEAGSKVNMSDLKADPLVMFQKKADPFWNLLWCFAFPSFVSLQWGESLWHGFLVAGVLKYILLLNATWAVNSVVHAWGNRPYNPSHLTTENGWVSLFTLGEGWHNWHHAFAWDYAASELGPLQQFNPTKVFIDTMALLGLAWDRKRAHQVWELRKARWVSEQGRAVVESLEGPPLFKHRVVTFGPALPEDSPPTLDNDDGTADNGNVPVEDGDTAAGTNFAEQ